MIAFLASVVGGFIGAWFARSTYDFMFSFLLRTPRWRRFDRAMARFFRARS
ncbi:hypothetical protein SAMN05660880_02379 [Luteibacter sp. 22Crub2.1]|nr:hypothetical protein SAMN05660880_02379 [Luteibacter sp. 22Crub2.1]